MVRDRLRRFLPWLKTHARNILATLRAPATLTGFRLGLILLLGAGPCAHAENGDCQAPEPGASAEVRHVIDGDTVILADGRHVRLLGIDAPELGRAGKPVEAYGPEAKDALARRLPPGDRHIQLLADGAGTDRYGRSLAHAFLADGTNIQAWLLKEGYARRYTASQGKYFRACYTAAEASAAAAKRGLWALPSGRAVAAGDLSPDTRGYRTVAGIVRHVNRTNASVWLELAPEFAVRIAREDWDRFPMAGLAAWQGRRLTARGYVYARDGQLRIRITDPSQLDIN